MLSGPVGRLEALLEEPEDREPREIALVCHPHPLHGGTMHNKVVYRIARGLRKASSIVLRFNFRGVNLSEGSYDSGEGELEDAASALNWLRTRYPDLPCTLAGFSFGSRIALRLGCRERGISRVIAVGFPAAYHHLVDLSNCLIPKIFVHSTHDQYGSVEELTDFVENLTGPKQTHFIAAEDHFFRGALDNLEETVSNLNAAI